MTTLHYWHTWGRKNPDTGKSYNVEFESFHPILKVDCREHRSCGSRFCTSYQLDLLACTSGGRLTSLGDGPQVGSAGLPNWVMWCWWLMKLCGRRRRWYIFRTKKKRSPLQGEINQLRGWPPGWFSWTSKLGNEMLMTDEIMWKKAKMIHLQDQKEKVATSWGD